ncbi:MAG: hypothetical protein IPM45_03635 [Acidimicrobiales bacterium]|nr:hypothetical protein [Acidimicrobiales bacterium]
MPQPDFTLEPIDDEQVLELLRPRGGGPGRVSLGRRIVDEFLASGQGAALLTYPDRKSRDAAGISIKNHLKAIGDESVWVRAVRGTTNLLLVNVPRSSTEVQAQHAAWKAVPRGRPARRG